MISFPGINFLPFDGISNNTKCHLSENQQKSKKKVSESLVSFWKKKSKDTDFIEDIKKHPILNRLMRYDTKFNNKRKVEFESSLAGVIRAYPRMLQLPVIKVAKAIAPDLIFSLMQVTYEGGEINWLHHHLYEFFSKNHDIMAEFTGEYGKKISSDLKDKIKFILWINNKLHSLDAKDFHCQLCLIREYGNFFLRPYAHLPNLNYRILPEGIGKEDNKIKMNELWNASRKALDENCPILTSRVPARPKQTLTNELGIFDSQSTYQINCIKKWCPKISVHLPGKNLWFVNSTSAFTTRVRFNLDMPLISSQGGSIALLLIPAIVIGNLKDEELKLFNLSAISYMISNGHHSLHEFKIIWNTFKIPYTDGSYKSLFPEGLIESHPELLELQKDFFDLI